MADSDYVRLGCKAEACSGEHKARGYCLRHYRQWQRGGVKQDATNCSNCGGPMQGKQADAMYCSRRCKTAAWVKANPERYKALPGNQRKASRVYAGYCQHCGSPFVSKVKRANCSARCDSAAWYAAHPVSIAPPARVCPMCRRQFAPSDAASMQSKMCSPACVEDAKRALHRVSRLKRKARQRAVTVESVDPLKVFDRDGWRCKLCGCRTPKAKRGTYADDAPELDHIVPLSKGGEHSYRNTQCACRRCNSDKSDAVRGQLLLIG